MALYNSMVRADLSADVAANPELRNLSFLSYMHISLFSSILILYQSHDSVVLTQNVCARCGSAAFHAFNLTGQL